MTLDAWAWLGAIVVVAASAALAVLAVRTDRCELGLVALVPAAAAIIIHAGAIGVTAPARGWLTVLLFALAVLGVLAGSPLSIWVLRTTEHTSVILGPGGGILAPPSRSHTESQREILRGGATIGYLERIAIVGAVAVGHAEVVAAIIAIKGLGRFTELSSSEARERFIIGTLVSMIWAVLCGALIWLANN
jgi:hypothetical protein